MVKIPVFKGSCTAIVTPFTADGVDYEQLKSNIDFQYENGTAAIVVCGTTGEAATLNQYEYAEVIRQAIDFNQGRMKLIVGVGSNNTQVALSNAKYARSLGADAILMVTPYYNKSTQKGLIEHFTYVADRVEIPMILYNVPSRTGVGIKADTYKILSEHPNINGVKEASGDIALVGATRSLCGDQLYIWSGNDDNTVPIMALGGLGVISVASNIIPGVIAKLCALCSEGDFAGATDIYSKYSTLISSLFIETNPIPIKAAMKLLGQDSGILRLPLTNIGESALSQLTAALTSVGLLPG
jgi:4-hydroxy-tetrahydrodipicolinate synthase